MDAKEIKSKHRKIVRTFKDNLYTHYFHYLVDAILCCQELPDEEKLKELNEIIDVCKAVHGKIPKLETNLFDPSAAK